MVHEDAHSIARGHEMVHDGTHSVARGHVTVHQDTQQLTWPPLSCSPPPPQVQTVPLGAE